MFWAAQRHGWCDDAPDRDVRAGTCAREDVKTLAGRPLFRVADAQFYCEDALIDGARRGDWEALERDTRESQACLRYARAVHALCDVDVASAAAEFRYARDLVAADDARRWLEDWGLGADEWMECVRRSVARRRLARELADLAPEWDPPIEELHAALQPSALCTGRLRSMAEALARAAAADAWLREHGEAPDGTDASDADDVRESPLARLAHGVPALDDGRAAERAAIVAALARSLERFAAQAATPRAIDERIALHRLDWIHHRSRVVAFASEAAAREAALCVREDGMDLGEVAADARTPVELIDGYLDEAPPALRDRLLAGGAGDVVGPVALDGHLALVAIDTKRVPDASDPVLRRRAEREVVERALAHAAQDRVHWQVPRM